jgi:uncharacterized membrane protein
MDFERLWSVWLVLPALVLLAILAWYSHRSLSPRRRVALLAVRSGVVILTLLAIAGPAWQQTTHRETVMFVLDHSQSQGAEKLTQQAALAARLASQLPAATAAGYVSAGQTPIVLSVPTTVRTTPDIDPECVERAGRNSNIADAVALAQGLMPTATAHRIVIIGDGMETRGDLEAQARRSATADVVIDVVPFPGQAKPDVRVASLRPSRTRLHEGAELELLADVESSLAGSGTIRLFENGIEVAAKPLDVGVGEQTSVRFRRTPDRRNLYTYRVVVEGFADDAIADNDEALAMVDVRGLPVLLYIEGEEGEAGYLTRAMAKEGIRLVVRPATAIPTSLADMAGYDGVIFSDIPATQLSELQMLVVRDYVEQLGGGFLMIGGTHSFGVGGYYRTPIEDILPVKMKAPDTQEKVATALALVIDRSGSMQGDKLELCKSAAIATVELLQSKDSVAVVAFDSSAQWVVPMTHVTSHAGIAAQIATLNSGGGTDMRPGLEEARKSLASINAKIKHMIVLTDGQTAGGDCERIAAQIHNEGVTISTVGVGQDAALGLLQTIAQLGGGQFYATSDASLLPRIFTQDAMTHMGRLIREEPFVPRAVERHEVTRGWPVDAAPQLLGYVKTHRKATAQVPLVTDLDDPLLASWQFGLGKVMAFTSDCKSRWSALWIATWPDGYSQFWSQLLREVARQPEGQLMDLRLTHSSDAGPSATGRGSDTGIDIAVDLMSDATQFRQGARVEYEAFVVPAHALESTLEPIGKGVLDQVGPGRYAGRVETDGPGVYLIRARSDSEIVSAGLVENVSGESATGRVQSSLLETVATLTGGSVVPPDAKALPRYERVGHARYVELRSLILKLLVLLFMIDVVIRRWEVVRSMATIVSSPFSRA